MKKRHLLIHLFLALFMSIVLYLSTRKFEHTQYVERKDQVRQIEVSDSKREHIRIFFSSGHDEIFYGKNSILLQRFFDNAPIDPVWKINYENNLNEFSLFKRTTLGPFEPPVEVILNHNNDGNTCLLFIYHNKYCMYSQIENESSYQKVRVLALVIFGPFTLFAWLNFFNEVARYYKLKGVRYT